MCRSGAAPLSFEESVGYRSAKLCVQRLRAVVPRTDGNALVGRREINVELAGDSWNMRVSAQESAWAQETRESSHLLVEEGREVTRVDALHVKRAERRARRRIARRGTVDAHALNRCATIERASVLQRMRAACASTVRPPFRWARTRQKACHIGTCPAPPHTRPHGPATRIRQVTSAAATRIGQGTSAVGISGTELRRSGKMSSKRAAIHSARVPPCPEPADSRTPHRGRWPR